MRVLVVGSRSFSDYELLKATLDKLLPHTDIEVVSGGAKGADSLAERYAKEKGYILKIFPADWNKYGKRAGYIRNAEMHEYISKSDERICIAFWDGESKGTQHNFDLAKRYGNHLEIVNYKELKCCQNMCEEIDELIK